MSSPDILSREADYIGYGFLAVDSKAVLRKYSDGLDLTADDKVILERAKEFLQMIVDGANFVTTGATGRHTLTESMMALDVAMDPLKQLQKLREIDGLSELFQALIQAISDILNNPNDRTQERIAGLALLHQFFDALYQSLANSLTQIQRTSPRRSPINTAKFATI